MRWIALLAVASGCAKQVGEGDGIVDDDEIPQVGWVAELIGHHHDVAGTAEIIDEDTIEIRDFVYDGGGINSRLFLLADGADFNRDIEISENLVGDDYDGDTLTLTIPDDVAPGDWNLISLWCLPASVSFGDGVFEAP